MGTSTSGAGFDDLQYQSGFGNEFSTEALPGALPVGQNNPRRCPYGLYAEQVSGTAFTAPRRANRRSWLYRTRPAVTHQPFHPVDFPPDLSLTADFSAGRGAVATPNQLRWRPFPLPDASDGVDFVRGLQTLCGAGAAAAKEGLAVHVYAATASMTGTCLANADGDMLLVPQLGALHVTTEFGRLAVAPGEIAVLPRGVRFAVALPSGAARGYVLETFGGQGFSLPELGAAGANGLAAPRDFLAPVAWFEDRAAPFTVLHKLDGQLFAAAQAFSPFNVVAWSGNYHPYKYDLSRFSPLGAVLKDHPDPSIFTVLTCPSAHAPGAALADFVVFPPRWAVGEGTFRPPYFHRNTMSEFMGLIKGSYDAKAGGGFLPGGASLHVCMTPHGPDAATFEAASADTPENEAPQRLPDDSLAFMFETYLVPRVTPAALGAPGVDRDYYQCWKSLRSHFDRDWLAKQHAAKKGQPHAAAAAAATAAATNGAG